MNHSKRKILLMRAVGIVVLSTLLIYFSACGGSGSVAAEQVIPEPPEDTMHRVKLLFIGDVMGHGPQIKSALDPVTNTYDYTPCFEYVKPVIESADLAVGNLEVTLSGKPPYTGYPRFRSPDALAYALKDAGFDLMVTANNHSNDGGLSALQHTIDTLKGLGFYQTGTFKNAAEREAEYPLIVFKNDFKLVFLNYTYGTNGLPTKAPAIVNMIDTAQIKKDMVLANAYQPDALIVLMHWGSEYQLIESKEQSQLAGRIFDWGADLIIGAHPHVVQPIKRKTVKRADGAQEEVLVTYSLGNFISNQQKTNTDGGLIVEIDLTKHKKTNEVNLDKAWYIPVWRYIEKQNNKTTFRAVPVSAFTNHAAKLLNMPEGDITKMKAFANKTRKQLTGGGAIERVLTVKDIFPDYEEAPGPATDSLVMPDTITKPKTEGATGMIYKIQWKATRTKQDVKPPVDTKSEIREENGWFKYLIGQESSYETASWLLNKVREAGFPGAFIVKYQNGMRIN